MECVRVGAFVVDGEGGVVVGWGQALGKGMRAGGRLARASAALKRQEG